MDGGQTASSSGFADRFTGALLGMAIGDALGVPHANGETNQSTGDSRLQYLSRPARADAPEIPAGQFSVNTELALCLLETLATSNGFIEPELALHRFANAVDNSPFLSESRETLAIGFATESDEFQAGGNSPTSGYAGPAARVTPIALAHSLSDLNIALVTREVLRSVLLTDGSPEVVNGGLAVAHAVRMAVRQEIPLELFIDDVLSLIDEDEVARAVRNGAPTNVGADVASVVSHGLHAFVLSEGNFERALSIAYAAGGATHLTGAIAGALCGAHVGASRIDQRLLEGLEGRAYVLMAAPALLRTAQMRAGLLFQLRFR